MGKNLHGIPAPIAQSQSRLSPTNEGDEMSKLTPEQKRKLEQSAHEPIAPDVSEDLANDPAIAPLLQTFYLVLVAIALLKPSS